MTQISPIRFSARGDSQYVIWHREAIKRLRFISPKLLRFISAEVMCFWRSWRLKQCHYCWRSSSSKPLKLTERVSIVLTTVLSEIVSKSQTNCIHKTNDEHKAMTTKFHAGPQHFPDLLAKFPAMQRVTHTPSPRLTKYYLHCKTKCSLALWLRNTVMKKDVNFTASTHFNRLLIFRLY